MATKSGDAVGWRLVIGLALVLAWSATARGQGDAGATANATESTPQSAAPQKENLPSLKLAPEDVYYGFKSKYYTSYVEDMCTGRLVKAVRCHMDDKGFVIGITYMDSAGDYSSLCNTGGAAYSKDVMCGPGESITGMRVCRGKRGGIKRVIFVKDSGEEVSCGNEEATWDAYEYLPAHYYSPSTGSSMGNGDGGGPAGAATMGSSSGSGVGYSTSYGAGGSLAFAQDKKGRKLHQQQQQVSLAEDARSDQTRTSRATWWDSCSFVSTAREPRWARRNSARPWYSAGTARGRRYRVNSRYYNKRSWVGPYTTEFMGYRPNPNRRASYTGYYRDVFPLAVLQGTCAYVGGPLSHLTARYTSCYIPPGCTIGCGGNGAGGDGSTHVAKVTVLGDVTVTCADLDLTGHSALLAGVQTYLMSVLQDATGLDAPAIFDTLQPQCEDHPDDPGTATWSIQMDVVPADATLTQLIEAMVPLDGEDYCYIAAEDDQFEDCDPDIFTEVVYRLDSEAGAAIPASKRFGAVQLNSKSLKAVLKNVKSKALRRSLASTKSIGDVKVSSVSQTKA